MATFEHWWIYISVTVRCIHEPLLFLVLLWFFGLWFICTFLFVFTCPLFGTVCWNEKVNSVFIVFKINKIYMPYQNGVTFDIVMHFYSLLFLSRKLVGFLCSISVDTLMRIVIMLLLYHLVIISLASLRLQVMNILLLPFVFYCHWFCFAYPDGDFCTFPSSYYFKLY